MWCHVPPLSQSPSIKAAVGAGADPRRFQAFVQRPGSNRAGVYYRCGQRLLGTSAKGGDGTGGDGQEATGRGVEKAASASVAGSSGLADDEERGPVNKVLTPTKYAV